MVLLYVVLWMSLREIFTTPTSWQLEALSPSESGLRKDKTLHAMWRRRLTWERDLVR